MHQLHSGICTAQAYIREYPPQNNTPWRCASPQSEKGGDSSATRGVQHMCVPYHIYECIRGSKRFQSHTRRYSFQDLNPPTSSWDVSNVRGGTLFVFHLW